MTGKKRAAGVLPHRYELVPVGSVKPHPDNPNVGDVTAIAQSIEENGFFGALVVHAATGHILAGEHRWKAARERGLARLPALLLDCDEDTARRILLADNRYAQLARWDDAALMALLNDLAVTPQGLTGTGFSDGDLARLAAGLSGGGPDDDNVPEPPADPDARPGDSWRLGPHRLLCGDATDNDGVMKMLDGDRCDCMWTDPPYGVAIVGGSHALSPAERLARGGKTIQNDAGGGDELPGLLAGAFAVASAALKPGAAVYIAHPAGALSRVFTDAFFNAGWRWHEGLVWVKDSIVLGHSDYHYRHEPIMYGYTAGEGRRGRGGAGWYGDNAQASVFEVPNPLRSADHPTVKPVELVARCLANSCPPRGLVYDPFGGTGSTLVAAHRLRLSARLVEIDPRYCDVICRRWAELSGEPPELVSGGA